jgi:hypothetical protein
MREVTPLVIEVEIPHRAARHPYPKCRSAGSHLCVVDTPVRQAVVVLHREYGGRANPFADALQVPGRHRTGPDQESGRDLAPVERPGPHAPKHRPTRARVRCDPPGNAAAGTARRGVGSRACLACAGREGRPPDPSTGTSAPRSPSPPLFPLERPAACCPPFGSDPEADISPVQRRQGPSPMLGIDRFQCPAPRRSVASAQHSGSPWSWSTCSHARHRPQRRAAFAYRPNDVDPFVT